MTNELYSNFCSKVTQLTRIIYLLNAKNEENRAIVDSVLEANSEENSKTVSKFVSEFFSYLNLIGLP